MSTIPASPPQFGRFANDQQFERIQALADRYFPWKTVDRQLCYYQTEPRLPLTGKHSPLYAQLGDLFESTLEAVDINRKGMAAQARQLDYFHLMTNLQDPDAYIAKLRNRFKRNPQNVKPIRIEGTNDVLTWARMDFKA